MSPKDKDLENLLKPLKDLKPNDLQMQQWQNAVKSEVTIGNAKAGFNTMWAFQLVAATLIGFVIGALLFKTHSDLNAAPRMAQISLDDATFEHSHDNLD